MRGRSDKELLEILQRVTSIEEDINEIQSHSVATDKATQTRIANFHFWVSVLVPAIIALLSTGVSAYITVVYKK